MTAPLIDGMAEFPLYSSTGESMLYVPSHLRQIGLGSNSVRIYFDPGVYSIMLTYDGPREVIMSIVRDAEAIPAMSPVPRLQLPTGAANTSRQVSTMVSVTKRACVFFRTNTPLSDTEVAAGYSLGVVITRMGMPTA